MTPHTADTTSLHHNIMGAYPEPSFMANTGGQNNNAHQRNNNNFNNYNNNNNQNQQFHPNMYPPSHPSNFSPPYTPDDENPDRKNGFLNITSLMQNNSNNNSTDLIDTLHNMPDDGLDNINHESLIPNINEFPTQSIVNPEKIYESSVRILYASVSWARSIPTFIELPFTDQALLLEECWSELFILCMIQCSVPMDLSVLLSAAGAHAEKETSSNVPGSVQDLGTLQHIVQRFQNLAIDATEFHSPEWAQQKGLFTEIFEDAEKMDEAVDSLAQKLAQSNPEAMANLKRIFWEGTENWDQLLSDRAQVSGDLVTSEFTKQFIQKFKKK